MTPARRSDEYLVYDIRKLGHQETIQKSEDMRFTSLENRILLDIKHSTSLFHR
jgi:hypothetical protein